MADDQPDDAVRAGLEHLQAAAREVIAATRSMLDAAEELVDDPKAVQSLVGTLSTLASAAASRLRSQTGASGGRDDDGDEGGIERIRIS